MGYISKIQMYGINYAIASSLYGTCGTTANTVEKAGEVYDFSELAEGVTLYIKFTYSNTATNPTLNVNGTGAKRIYRYGTTAPGKTEALSWAAGSIVSFTYDGTAWLMNDFQDTSAISETVSSLSAHESFSKVITFTEATTQPLSDSRFTSDFVLSGYQFFDSNGAATGEVLADISYETQSGTCSVDISKVYASGSVRLDFSYSPT